MWTSIAAEKEARELVTSLGPKEPKDLTSTIRLLYSLYKMMQFSPLTRAETQLGRKAWNSFCETGNPKSPEQSLLACLLDGSILEAKVTTETARMIFFRFREVPETMTLLWCYYSKLPIKPIAEYEELLQELRHRISVFPKGLVYEGHRDGYNSLLRLRCASALFMNILAEGGDKTALKTAAKSTITEVLKDPQSDGKVKRVAQQILNIIQRT